MGIQSKGVGQNAERGARATAMRPLRQQPRGRQPRQVRERCLAHRRALPIQVPRIIRGRARKRDADGWHASKMVGRVCVWVGGGWVVGGWAGGASVWVRVWVWVWVLGGWVGGRVGFIIIGRGGPASLLHCSALRARESGITCVASAAVGVQTSAVGRRRAGLAGRATECGQALRADTARAVFDTRAARRNRSWGRTLQGRGWMQWRGEVRWPLLS